MSVIITPDQRIRVFISSTILELANERIVVRNVIEALRMTPVFFESGARPHPPRELYRSYLDQSDIFIGIYWEKYGWTAPGMEISGLEDEWILAVDKPQLIYIKNTALREPDLDKLIKKIQDTGSVSYQRFNEPSDLSKLLANDLALLLAERFQSNSAGTKREAEKTITNIPRNRNKIIGREVEINEIIKILHKPETELITLVGPGGIGKTRLAIEIGNRIIHNFEDGIFFINLESLVQSDKLPLAISNTLDIQNKGGNDIQDWVAEYLSDKNMLLILDNFEQIIEGAIFVSTLISRCARIKLLVTSRTPLNIRNEYSFLVEPLKNEQPDKTGDQEYQYSNAVTLFIQRATEANNTLIWNSQNTDAALEICNKLDGLPLAIELAAARCRYMNPATLVTKLVTLLDSIGTGHRDAPKRQKTIRNTIDWSYQLLGTEAQRLFRRLAIFETGWDMESAKAICWDGFNELSTINLFIEELENLGLLVNLQSSTGINTHKFLKVIKEYAEEKLQESGESAAITYIHYKYFYQFAIDLYTQERNSWLSTSNHSLQRLKNENILLSFNNALKAKDYPVFIKLVSVLNFIFLLTGETWFLLDCLEQANIKSDEEGIRDLSSKIDPSELANVYLSAGFCRSTTGNFIEGMRDLEVAHFFAEKYSLTYVLAETQFFMALSMMMIGKIEPVKSLLLDTIDKSRQCSLLSIQFAAEATYGILLSEENKFDEAINILDKSIQSNKEYDILLGQTYCLYQKGFLMIELQKYEEANSCFEQCLVLNKTYSLNINASFPYVGQALIHAKTGNTILGFDSIRNAMECYRKSGSTIEFVCLLCSLCILLIEENKLAEALSVYTLSRKIFSGVEFNPWRSLRNNMKIVDQKLQSKFPNIDFQVAIASNNQISNEKIFELIKRK